MVGWRRLLVVLGPIACVVLVAGGCGDTDDQSDDGASTVLLTEAESTTEVLVATGDRLEVRLESNPSTGYRWEVVAPIEETTLELVEHRTEAPDTDLVGAPGTEVFVYAATGYGAGVLRLEYLRPFDDPPVAERIAEYVVRVDEAPWPPDDVTVPGTSSASVDD